MDVIKKYSVYEMNNVMGSKKHKALQKVEFEDVSNNFDTEDEAIQALLNDRMHYEDYVILRIIFIN